MTTTTARSPRKKTRSRTDFRQLDLQQLYGIAERLDGLPVPGVRMSEAEFVAWCDEDLRAEWVDGEVILMPPVSDAHDDANTWLITLLRMLVEEQELGVIRQDIFVRLANQRRRRVPDLLFVAKNHLDLLKPTYLDGAPDLVMEIVSPDSQSRDRREKYQEYEKAGVREYWIIDPLSQMVEVYRIRGKRFQLIEEHDGIVASTVIPKLRLKTALLWRKPLPKIAGLLRQLGVRS